MTSCQTSAKLPACLCVSWLLTLCTRCICIGLPRSLRPAACLSTPVLRDCCSVVTERAPPLIAAGRSAGLRCCARGPHESAARCGCDGERSSRRAFPLLRGLPRLGRRHAGMGPARHLRRGPLWLHVLRIRICRDHRLRGGARDVVGRAQVEAFLTRSGRSGMRFSPSPANPLPFGAVTLAWCSANTRLCCRSSRSAHQRNRTEHASDRRRVVLVVTFCAPATRPRRALRFVQPRHFGCAAIAVCLSHRGRTMTNP